MSSTSNLAWFRQQNQPQTRMLSSAIAALLGLAFLVYISSPVSLLSPTGVAHPISRVGNPKPTTPAERTAESEEFYKGMLQDRKAFLRRLGGKEGLTSFPGGGNYYQLWDFFLPEPSFCQHRISRVGTLGDGGKWVCGLKEIFSTKKDCVVYSFGINGESSFEAAMLDAGKGCEIWGYDFSVNSFGPQIPRADASRAHFFPYMLSSQQKPKNSPPEWTLGGLMKENGHKWVDLIKMDIESSEFGVLDAFLDEFKDNLPFGQLQLEIHCSSEHNFEQFLKWWESLEAAGLRPFWVEPNLVYINWTGAKATLTEFAFMNIHRPELEAPSSNATSLRKTNTHKEEEVEVMPTTPTAIPGPHVNAASPIASGPRTPKIADVLAFQSRANRENEFYLSWLSNLSQLAVFIGATAAALLGWYGGFSNDGSTSKSITLSDVAVGMAATGLCVSFTVLTGALGVFLRNDDYLLEHLIDAEGDSKLVFDRYRNEILLLYGGLYASVALVFASSLDDVRGLFNDFVSV
ncbi:hypothetical protein RQP46_009699 [Phenoliferia psychrophenolica]